MRQDVVDAAREYLGVRWVHQGRQRKRGLDCLGLIVVVAEDLGYKPQDYLAYNREPDPLLLQELVNQQFIKVDREPEAGDMVLIHFHARRKSPYHFGIISEKGTLIHGHGPSRKVVEQPVRMYADQIHSVYEFPEVN